MIALEPIQHNIDTVDDDIQQNDTRGVQLRAQKTGFEQDLENAKLVNAIEACDVPTINSLLLADGSKISLVVAP